MPNELWWRVCEACGHAANQPVVQPSIAKLPDQVDGRGRVVTPGAYMDVVRCRDVEACRVRCAAAGRAWPFEESRRPDPYIARGREG